jgi:membrane protease YdiL (CAAX protease family)
MIKHRYHVQEQGAFFMDISSSGQTVVSSSNGLRRFLQRHALVCYFLMAYGFSWIAWLPYVLSKSGVGILPITLNQFAALPGAYLGPFLSGVLMTAALEGKPGVGRLLRRFVQWRVSWYWYPAVLCGVPIVVVAGYLALPSAEHALHPVVPQILWIFPLALIMEILTSGLAEEPGWRGFALPRLQQQLGPLLGGGVILGILWQCWHLPLYLTDWGGGAGWLEIGEAIIGNIGLTIVITWVFNRVRGSLLITILLHSTLDAFGVAAATSLFSTQWMIQNGNMALLLGFGAVALVLVVVTRGRLGYQQASSDTASIFDEGKS